MRSGSRSGLLAVTAAAGALVAGLAVAGPSSAAANTGPSSAAASTTAVTTMHLAGRVTGAAAKNPFCGQVGTRFQVSAGAMGFCFGPHTAGSGGRGSAASRNAVAAPANTDAASLSEDVSPGGGRAYGQSEVSIAAAGKYVVEAWNDSTAFSSPCGSPMYKEEITGLGFSANGGKSFTDLGGVPNKGCAHYLYEGDPTVATYQSGGKTWFYIGSLFDSPTGTGSSKIAMAVCEASGAKLSCNTAPVVLANSERCIKQSGHTFCDFLDKEFISVDPVRHRLYATYTDFPVSYTTATTSVDAAMCDLSNPAKPACEVNPVGKPAYETLEKTGASPCESEGSYPAVDQATGDLYVAYEYNWGSSQGVVACETTANAAHEVLDRVPFSCLTRTPVARCGVARQATTPVISLEGALIPGYNRFPASDFPRIAVSDRYHTVSIVWNDTRYHPLGDILLQSFNLGSLAPVQHTPVVLDAPIAGGLNFLPALRLSDANGKLDVTWFSRRSTQTADTNVYGALGIDPRTTSAPRANTLITNVASNWLDAVSDIVPNFGDYTDNYVAGSTLYVAWSDGRLAVTQPFEAHLPA